MKITFKRNLQLQVYHVFLTLKYEEERKDFQNFIKSFQDQTLPNDGISSKILRYLQQLGLVNLTGSLTSEGKKTRETGLFQVFEQGVYRAWITTKDKLLGTRIIALNRVSIDRNDQKDSREKTLNPEFLPMIDSTEQHLLLAEEDSKHPQSHQVRSTKALLLNDNFSSDEHSTFLNEYNGFYIKDWIQPSNSNDDPAIELSANEKDEQVSIVLKGICNLKIRDKDTGCEGDLSLLNSNLEPLDYSFREFIEDAFINMDYNTSYKFQRWDDDELALRVKYSDLEGEERERGIRGMMNFRVSDDFYGGLGSVVVTDLPLLADDELEAQKWRNDNFIHFLQKEYRLPDECESYLEELHHNFPPIASQLSENNIPDKTELNEIVSIKNTTKAYWHYYAPIDLNPQI